MPTATASTVRDLRRNNRSRALWALHLSGPLTRQEVGTASGVSLATVSNVLGELIAEGVVEAVGSEDSNGGRPRGLFRLNPAHGYVIGVDIGETAILVELFDLGMTLLASHRSLTRLDGLHPEKAVASVVEGIEAVIAESEVPAGSVLGVGVGVPGIVEHRDTAIIHAQTVGWHAVPFEAMLRQSIDLPVRIENGANTLGQAESWFGAAQDASTAAIVLLGIGVGATLIAGTTPQQERNLNVGEWGHTKIVVDGRPCRCGSVGCVEAYVGANALAARYGELSGVHAAPENLEAWVAELFESEATDEIAHRVIDETATYLGAGLANIVNLFRPDRIVIGSWFGRSIDSSFVPRVRDAASRYALELPFAQVSFAAAQLGSDAVAMGAATLPIEHFLNSGAIRVSRIRRDGRAPTAFAQ